MKLRYNMSIVVARTINQFSFCIMLQTFLAVLTAIVLIYKCHLLKKRNCSHYSRRDHVTMVPDMTTAWTWSPVEPVELCEMASKSIRLPIKLMQSQSCALISLHSAVSSTKTYQLQIWFDDIIYSNQLKCYHT